MAAGDGAIPALPVIDTLKRGRDAMIERVWQEVWSKVDLASYGM